MKISLIIQTGIVNLSVQVFLHTAWCMLSMYVGTKAGKLQMELKAISRQ